MTQKSRMYHIQAETAELSQRWMCALQTAAGDDDKSLDWAKNTATAAAGDAATMVPGGAMVPTPIDADATAPGEPAAAEAAASAEAAAFAKAPAAVEAEMLRRSPAEMLRRLTDATARLESKAGGATGARGDDTARGAVYWASALRRLRDVVDVVEARS